MREERNLTDDNNRPDNVLNFEEINPPEKKKGSILKYFIALFIAIVLVYAIGAFYYSSHFSHNTIINGLNVGGMTPNKASKLVAENTKEYQLRLNEKDDTEVIKGSDIELTLDMTNEVNELFKKHNPFLWPKNFFKKESANIMGFVSYDTDLLNSQIDQLHCLEDMEKPQDAYIQYKDNKYVIVPEEEGTTVDKKKLKEVITDAISNFKKEISLTEEGVYEKPALTQNDTSIKAALEQANLYTTAVIKYLPDTMEMNLDFNTTKDWVVLDKEMNISLNDEKVNAYVDELSKKFNNPDGIVSFTSHSGATKEFQSEDYVWEVDKKKEAETIKSNLKEGKEVSREPVYAKKSTIPVVKGVGPLYIEVSLSDNHAWLYKENYVVADSDVLIGNVDKGLFLVKDVNEAKITFHDEQGFIINNSLDQTTSTQNQTQTTQAREDTDEDDEDNDDEDNEDEDNDEEEATTEAVQNTNTAPRRVSTDNIECRNEFFTNLKNNVQKDVPVIIY